MKDTNGVVTKYVYGHGLIGEKAAGSFKTYHFDYRGSTVAVTNTNGAEIGSTGGSAKTNFSMGNNEIKGSFSIGIGLTIGVSW